MTLLKRGRRPIAAMAMTIIGMIAAALTTLLTANPAQAVWPFPDAPCSLASTNGTATGKWLVYGFDYPRQYNLHVPAGLTGPAPLLISLHDYQSDAAGQETASGWSTYADSKKFIVAYPSGTNGTWVPMDGNPDAAFIKALAVQISKDHCVNPKRTFVEGKFLGGEMSEKVACDDSDVFAGAILYDTRDIQPLGSCNPANPVAVGVLQPENDGTNDLVAGRALRDIWRTKDGCTGTGTAWSTRMAPKARCTAPATAARLCCGAPTRASAWLRTPPVPR